MLSVALKEWHLLCSALLTGRQTIMLRKGGILEANAEFELEHPKFLLFPTFVHQDPASVKPAWRDQIVRRTTEPEQVFIEGWGQCVKIFEVPSRPAMDSLDDLHLWDKPLLDMRFNYRPNQPLYLLVVKAFRLPQPVTLPYAIEYAGCKSWVTLQAPLPTAGSTPALADDQLHGIIARITMAFGA